MRFDMQHKLLFGGLSLLILILGGLFILTFIQLRTINNFDIIRKQNQYLRDEEGVVVVGQEGPRETSEEEGVVIPIQPALFEYIEVIGGCASDFEGDCLNVRSGPGTDFPVVSRLRNGVVLKVSGIVQRDNNTWYKIVFDEWIRYPQRIQDDWYVSADYVRILMDEGLRTNTDSSIEPTDKRIIVSREEQKLWAYDGGDLFMEIIISTGVELTPTPKGTFTIFRKTPSRYMQGPLPGISNKYWDLPGVPWNLYFTHDGAVIHGTYWHNNFGSPSSNGCVNVTPSEMEKLYKWAELGTKVIVVD